MLIFCETKCFHTLHKLYSLTRAALENFVECSDPNAPRLASIADGFRPVKLATFVAQPCNYSYQVAYPRHHVNSGPITLITFTRMPRSMVWVPQLDAQIVYDLHGCHNRSTSLSSNGYPRNCSSPWIWHSGWCIWASRRSQNSRLQGGHASFLGSIVIWLHTSFNFDKWIDCRA